MSKNEEEFDKIVDSYDGFRFPFLRQSDEVLIGTIAGLRIDGYFDYYYKWFQPFGKMCVSRTRMFGFEKE